MNRKRQLNILLACGGSGGHIFPGLVVREELVHRGHRVFLAVSDKKVDTQILAALKLKPDLVLKANTSDLVAPLRTIRNGYYILHHLIRSRNFLQSSSVDFVLGMGGFNCAAPLFAARSLRIPCGLHESNAIPGKVTRICKGFVDVVFVGFKQCYQYLNEAKNVLLTGTPTRFQTKEVEKKRSPENYLAQGLDPQKKTVLVIGGSQGSQFLNNLLANSAPLFAVHRDAIQFIHISGKPQHHLEIHPLDDLGITYKHYQFYNDMDRLYALADVVVSRAGSGVITEILELGKKAVLIPLPTAADNHQWHNSKAVENAGNIEVLEQSEATPAKLLEKILTLLAERRALEPKCGFNAKPRPETLIANYIENVSELNSYKTSKP